MNLLTIGIEYSGSMHLSGCGIKSANIFEEAIKEKMGDNLEMVISLRGKECTAQTIISSIKHITSNGKRTIIYICSHGDHRFTKDYMLEYWNTASGCLDQIQIGNLLNDALDTSFVILFSESCSSEHMINHDVIKKRYVSIGATQDREDAMLTCDGGLLAMTSIDIIKTIPNDCKISDFTKLLLASGVTVEHFAVAYSDEGILEEIMF